MSVFRKFGASVCFVAGSVLMGCGSDHQNPLEMKTSSSKTALEKMGIKAISNDPTDSNASGKQKSKKAGTATVKKSAGGGSGAPDMSAMRKGGQGGQGGQMQGGASASTPNLSMMQGGQGGQGGGQMQGGGGGASTPDLSLMQGGQGGQGGQMQGGQGGSGGSGTPNLSMMQQGGQGGQMQGGQQGGSGGSSTPNLSMMQQGGQGGQGSGGSGNAATPDILKIRAGGDKKKGDKEEEEESTPELAVNRFLDALEQGHLIKFRDLVSLKAEGAILRRLRDGTTSEQELAKLQGQYARGTRILEVKVAPGDYVRRAMIGIPGERGSAGRAVGEVTVRRDVSKNWRVVGLKRASSA